MNIPTIPDPILVVTPATAEKINVHKIGNIVRQSVEPKILFLITLIKLIYN